MPDDPIEITIPPSAVVPESADPVLVEVVQMRRAVRRAMHGPAPAPVPALVPLPEPEPEPEPAPLPAPTPARKGYVDEALDFLLGE